MQHKWQKTQCDQRLHVDMHTPEADCQELVEKTAASIDNDVLQLLFVSVQQTNLKTCIQYAIRRYFKKSKVPSEIQECDYHISIVFRTTQGH